MAAATTPAEITPEIAAFCAEISEDAPSYVPVEPPQGAQPDDCFFNVRRVVEVNGGTAIFGWTIWQRPGVYVEAENHAVWLPPLASGPIDVTPKADGEARILFLPDAKAAYDGVLARGNIRKALVDDPIVHSYLAAGDAIDASRKPVDGRRVWRSASAMMKAAKALEALNQAYPPRR